MIAVVGSPLIGRAPPPVAGIASQLAIETQPAGATDSIAFETQPVIQVLDATGAVVTTSSVEITAAKATGTGTIGGDTTKNASSGIATFTDLEFGGTGAGHSIAFTSPGLTTATSNVFEVFEAPLPPEGNIVFHSDWSTDTGTGDDALRDTDKDAGLGAWTTTKGNGTRNIIIAAPSGHGHPTPNVYRNVGDCLGGTGVTLGDELALGASGGTNGPLPSIAIGESLRYRWYVSIVIADGLGDGEGDPHNPQNGFGGVSVSTWYFGFNIGTNNLWRPKINTGANSFPNNFWAPYPAGSETLEKNHAYRMEVEILKIGASTMNLNFWMFDNADNGNTQIYGNSHMINANGGSGGTTGNLGGTPTLNMHSNFATHGKCAQWGYNGTNLWTGAAYHTQPLFDISAVAIATGDGTQGPIGPYSGGI